MWDLAMDDKETIYEEIVMPNISPAVPRQRINTYIEEPSPLRHELHGSDTCKSRYVEGDYVSAGSEGRNQCNFPLEHDSHGSVTSNLLPQSTSFGSSQDLVTSRRPGCINDRPMVIYRSISCQEPVIRDFESAMYRPNLQYCGSLKRIGTNSLDSGNRGKSLLRELIDQNGEKTEYAEIVTTSPVTEISLTPSRATRESDNPLLRRDVLPSPSTAFSRTLPKDFDRRSTQDSTASHDSGFQEDSGAVYENAGPANTKHIAVGCFPRSISDTPVYENAAIPAIGKTTSLHRIESLYENMDDVGMKRRNSLPEGKIYENMSQHGVTSRPRSSSKPIEIRYNSPRRSEKELLYSDIDFGEGKTHRRIPSGGSQSSCSSPISLSSSMSSLSSNSASASVSPPPPIPVRPPSMRRRPYSAYYPGIPNSDISCFGALYVGAHPVVRITTEVIDSALRDVVHRAKMRSLRSVMVNLGSEGIKLGSTSTTEEFTVSFAAQDIHTLQPHPKDCRVFGIVCSKPREDGVCFVLRSEQALEIMENWKDNLHRPRPKISNCNSVERPVPVLMDSRGRPSTNVVKIGVIKVKKSYLVINESISALLTRTNPRDFRRVSFDVDPRCITISNCETSSVEEQHAVQRILSLGVYNEDNRYFGYIASDTTQGSKTKLHCYVYRCSYVLQARSLLETIRSVHQNINLLHNSQMSTSPRYITNPQHKVSEGSLKRIGSKLGLDKSHDPKHKNSNGLCNDQSLKGKTEKINDDTTGKFTDAPLKRFGSILGLAKPQNSSQESPKEDHGIVDEKTTPKLRQRLFSSALIRRKISKESQPPFKVCTITDEDKPNDVEIKEAKFSVAYLCSTIVNPPLRPKHVKECLRQYQKEMNKAQKTSDTTSIGNTLELRLSLDTGVQILDPKNANAFRKEFPWCSVDRFMGHPENADCFAFSTSISGNSKHNCHVFCRFKDSFADIQRLFEAHLSLKCSS